MGQSPPQPWQSKKNWNASRATCSSLITDPSSAPLESYRGQLKISKFLKPKQTNFYTVRK